MPAGGGFSVRRSAGTAGCWLRYRIYKADEDGHDSSDSTLDLFIAQPAEMPGMHVATTFVVGGPQNPKDPGFSI